MKERVYMLVTQDKYELPMDFSTSIGELAEKYNTTKSYIYNCTSKKRSGKKNGLRFVKVTI